MNNKYKIGDMVTATYENESKVGKIHSVNEYENYDILFSGRNTTDSYHESYLTPYIEEDTTEDEQVTMHVHISDNDAKVNVFGQEPITLDYQDHYEALLEEHEETKELLEIAKAALKLTSELI